MLPNEILITEGDALQEIYFVLSGIFSVGSEESESFSTVGPGGVLGDMSFLTGNAPSATVAALEEGSVVLAVPRDSVAGHLIADAGFAVRFYRMTATLLSERLRNLIALFITSPTIKTDTKAGPSLRGPVRLFEERQPDFGAIQRLVDSLPPVSNICNGIQRGLSNEGAMAQREQTLSVATMAAESIQLLLEVARNEGVTDLDRRIVCHKPSLSAAEKQSILPDSLIQKTVTILIENKFVLCSSIGDLKISRKLLGDISVMLGFPRRGLNTYINPAAFIPEIELGLLRGMVSTFFSPGRITQLELVALIAPSSSQMPDVAVSLSPCESLLLPFSLFPAIVKKYAQHAYPYVPFALLPTDSAPGPADRPK